MSDSDERVSISNALSWIVGSIAFVFNGTPVRFKPDDDDHLVLIATVSALCFSFFSLGGAFFCPATNQYHDGGEILIGLQFALMSLSIDVVVQNAQRPVWVVATRTVLLSLIFWAIPSKNVAISTLFFVGAAFAIQRIDDTNERNERTEKLLP